MEQFLLDVLAGVIAGIITTLIVNRQRFASCAGRNNHFHTGAIPCFIQEECPHPTNLTIAHPLGNPLL